MKLKYYLRGLGIGIVVTVFIMMAALGNKQPMTDEEVMARAKELGMIENSVLKDIAGKDDETTVSDDKTDETYKNDNAQNGDDESSNVNEQDAVEPENADTEEAVEPEKTEDTTEIKKDVISITVVGGDSSWTVSKRMEEAGLIESAKDFDTHLCRYGYDKRISVGTYEIPTDATHEEMAKILTKQD